MNKIFNGDCREILKTLPDKSINCCVTSPPYYGVRDYEVDGQIGLEKTFDEYVRILVGVFHEVKRVLRIDGTLWLNLGDNYLSQRGKGLGGRSRMSFKDRNPGVNKPKWLKAKNLLGLPWRVAFALQADGWNLRSDIIWYKPNPMMESMKDRPTKSHEYIFLMSKARKYYYDQESIKEKTITDRDSAAGMTIGSKKGKLNTGDKAHTNTVGKKWIYQERKNKQDVWKISTVPFKGAHFATFPPKLIEPCILAGCPSGGVVLDPFAGTGTTLYVAQKFHRKYIGIELNPKDIKIAEGRLMQPRMI